MLLAELVLVTGLLAVDGDSLLFRGERIRVLGVDAPEIHCQCESECRAAWAAKRFTQETLDRGAVTLERQGLDKYRRTGYDAEPRAFWFHGCDQPSSPRGICRALS